MAINPFKAGRAVGKGITYLTKLGSKIGKSVGGAVDKLGAGTRSTQASVIKGARGARDAVNTAGRGVAQAGRDARRGYDVGRKGGLTLSDVADPMPKKSSSVNKLPSLNEWMNTRGKGMIRNPMTMPGNKPSGMDNTGRYKTVGDAYKAIGRDNAGRISNAKNIKDGMARRGVKNPGITMKYQTAENVKAAARGAGSPGSNGKNWAVPVKNPELGWGDRGTVPKRFKNAMTKGSGGIINKPPGGKRPASGAGDYMSNSPKGNKYTIGPRYSDDVFAAREVAKHGSRMASKNRRAGIITAGSVAAGYGVHKGNEALQNHYQRQKNASR